MEALNIILPFSEENFTPTELCNSFYDYIYPWQKVAAAGFTQPTPPNRKVEIAYIMQ